MLQAAMDAAAGAITGTVRLKLYKGNVIVTGRRAPHSVYDPTLASFEAGGTYAQRDAEGFIRLNGLRLRLRALAGRPAGNPTGTPDR
jgi:argininosuccinate synthase